MSGAALSIKLRCASWQQLATIYKRDLSRGSMFLKASTQPAIGTIVKIDLELPSATVIELTGTIVKHVTDPQRGTGVDLQLEPLPTKSVWMIENALAAETKVRATSQSDTNVAAQQAPHRAPTLTDGEDISAAEVELIRALEAEAESLKKLNPFLVLGVGYETSDADVRHAFGELTKRYHPDRFARYQSPKLRQIAAEIFILIRDAYRRLADDASRQQVIATLGRVPTRAQTQPRGSGPQPPRITPPRIAVPAAIPPIPPKSSMVPDIPTTPGQPITQQHHDAPTNPSGKSAELAHTELARAEQNLAIPVEAQKAESGKFRKPVQTPPGGFAATDKLPAKRPTASPVVEPVDTTAVDNLIDEGKLDEALNAYRTLAKKHPQDRSCRAGIELVEGLKALAARDRLEAAQRFEAALEIDPSNERAARELAEMRRQATNERKGLLSRLMGKKEPLP
ncbi:MAG TPA: DnaJ domain-containing protein [Kofleriaceae bacterium]|nr:DnaJ domain-containing protein [Kofleriaceae bacterium]